jgi:hypothetical protein
MPSSLCLCVSVVDNQPYEHERLLQWRSPMINDRRFCSFVALILAIGCVGISAGAEKLSKEQQLVVAAFELDAAKVKTLLDAGVDPNVRLGKYDDMLFRDKWSGGYSKIGSNKWTALLAVANSNREPQPPKLVENTSEALAEAQRKRDAVDPKLIAARDAQRVAVARLLIRAKADLDLDDGYGETALSASVYNRFDELSLLLIAAGAAVNTKTGIYIDGPGDITPLHRATDRPKILAAMLKKGGKVNVADTTGETPLHWAVRAGKLESVKLLVEAGADVAAKDKENKTPAYWCEVFEGIEPPDDTANKKAILKLLKDATKKN